MCLILKNNPADPLSFDEVADIWSRNRDGFGAVYRTAKGPTTWRTMPRSAREAWEAYQPFARTDAHLHWRMCTHGPVRLDMAHPFTSTCGRWAVLHNGVLSGLGSATESDTAQWVRDVLSPMLAHYGDGWRGEAVRWAIEAQIAGSAVVVTDLTTGHAERYGRAGVTHRGRWYSNTYAWSVPTSDHGSTVTVRDLYDALAESDPWLASLLLTPGPDREWAIDMACDALGIDPWEVAADDETNETNETEVTR